MSNQNKISVLFVCLGNICRSPAAEGTFRHLVAERKQEHRFNIDSAGTGSYHIGASPNPQAQKAAKAYGIPLKHKARKFEESDFDRFDCILAMDQQNYSDILSLARNEEDRKKTMLYRRFDPEVADPDNPPDVPDPYYGGFSGFEKLQVMFNRTSEKLLLHFT